MALDLSNLSAEDIEALKTALGLAQPSFRTGQRKILTDLRTPQSASGKLYRPHFEWSAETPPEGVTIPPFPRLYWQADGTEGRFESQADMDAKIAADPTLMLTPPNMAPLTKQQQLEREIAALSPEDRAFLIESEHKARLARTQALMDGMSSAEVASVMATNAPTKAKKSA